MASIYRQAELVILYVGSSTYETDLLLGPLDRLHKLARKEAYNKWTAEDKRWNEIWSLIVPDCHLYAEYTKGLKQILERSWFKRVWILQECAHATRAVIACGRKYVAARIFAIAPLLIGIQPKPHCQAVLDIVPGSPRESWWSQKEIFYPPAKVSRK